MYATTQALVLGTVKYGDSSRILKCYTENFGMQTYMINSMKGKNAALKPSMVLPLTQLELVATHKAKGALERIKEARVNCSYSNFATDPVKNALALFLAEVMSKSLQEEQANQEKFAFVTHACQLLDAIEIVPAHFHHSFLVDLTKYLGFYPDTPSAEKGVFFDLMEGVFLPLSPLHPNYMRPESTAALKMLMRVKLGDASVRIPKAVRKDLLNELLHYYKLHVGGFGQLKSVEILEELFA